MKKLVSILCAGAMLLSLAACGAKTNTAYAGQTITGKVTALEGTSVALALGELTENTAPGGDSQQPPEMPSDGQTGDQPTGTPPEKPEGTSDDNQSGQQPPEKPDGDSNQQGGSQPPEMPGGSQNGQDGGTPPDMPEGGMDGGSSFTESGETLTIDIADAAIVKNGENVSAAELSVDDVVQVTFDDSGSAATVEIVSGGKSGGFGGSSQVTQGSSANTISEDGAYTDTAYTSTGDDENALRVDGATVTLDGVTVDKSAGATSNTENGDFYGVNAALLATNGANVTITNATVTSSAQNGNGVFSYGSGTTVNISESMITTTADNSGGIQTTGGGTTNATNLVVSTSGNSSAAIRSDRGGGIVNVDGGIVNVDGGSYVSNGYNSPAVYSTADITVKNAILTANNSEALVIEGKNSIALENCDVTGNMSDTKGSSSEENVHNVMIYQSMSGDADVGTSTFSMTGGTLIGKNGDMIYVTNTHCVLTLSGVTIKNEDADGALLRVVGNSASHGWGAAGSNGAQVEFTADSQTLNGDIVVDTISTLNMKLTNGSSFTGTINIVDNAQGGTAVSNNAVVTIESGCTWTLTGDCTWTLTGDCTWTLTGDCTITSLTNSGTINFNGYTITLADGTVRQ